MKLKCIAARLDSYRKKRCPRLTLKRGFVTLRGSFTPVTKALTLIRLEAESYQTCDAPATKQLGKIWLCDHHFSWHEDEFIDDGEGFYPIMIVEASCLDDE